VFRRATTAAGDPAERAGTLVPLDTGVCFSSVSMTAGAAYVDALMAAFDAQHIAVDAYYPELGHGQHELPLRHAPALRAADNQIWFRETVRGVASALGLVASVAPKPMLDQAGNGSHLHWSLWDAEGSRNLLHDAAAPYGLSDLGRHVAAGVLDHLPALLALTAPTVNSFRRLQPQFWSSAYVSWGPDNREASVRVVSGRWDDEEASANLELKACDASCNPYLALGGVIAAGLDGLDRALDPGEATLVDPATLSEEERQYRGLARYPTTSDAPFDALETDPVLLDALGPDLARSYIAVKRSEAASFAAGGDDLELAHFRDKL
jgi:glutamine synthetase